MDGVIILNAAALRAPLSWKTCLAAWGGLGLASWGLVATVAGLLL